MSGVVVGSFAASLAMLVYYVALLQPNDLIAVAPVFVGRWLLAWTAVAAVVDVPFAGLLELRAWLREHQG